MSQQFYCDICKELKLFEQILSFSCGHCFCASCVASHKETGSRLCPHCRYIIKNDSGHRLYITFNDPSGIFPDDGLSSDTLSGAVEAQANYVIKRLGRMDASSSLKTVKKAEENLVKVVDALEGGECASKVIDAITGFRERVIPVFTELENRQRRVTELELQLAEVQHDHEKRLQTQRQQIEKLESAQRNLRADQTRAERITNEAIASTEEATRRALALREENQKLLTERAVVLKNLEKEKEKDEELRRYKGFCDDFKKKEALNKAKMKGLRQKNSDLKRELDHSRSRNDLDDSLRIVDRSHLLDGDFDGPQAEGSHTCHRLVSRCHSRPSLNRNPLGDCPSAPIMQADIDLDDDLRPFATYKSDWTFSKPPAKKLKVSAEDGKPNMQQGPPFPLRLDSKGRTKGTVQLGSKTRMGK